MFVVLQLHRVSRCHCLPPLTSWNTSAILVVAVVFTRQSYNERPTKLNQFVVVLRSYYGLNIITCTRDNLDFTNVYKTCQPTREDSSDDGVADNFDMFLLNL